MKTQRSFRLKPSEDETLERRIVEHAAHGQQGDLIRYALYHTLEMEIPASLRGVAGMFERPVEPVPHATAPAHDDIRELWRVIAELKEDIAALQGGVKMQLPALQGDGEQDRQDVLSGKLKKLSFGGLLQ